MFYLIALVFGMDSIKITFLNGVNAGCNTFEKNIFSVALRKYFWKNLLWCCNQGRNVIMPSPRPIRAI